MEDSRLHQKMMKQKGNKINHSDIKVSFMKIMSPISNLLQNEGFPQLE